MFKSLRHITTDIKYIETTLTAINISIEDKKIPGIDIFIY